MGLRHGTAAAVRVIGTLIGMLVEALLRPVAIASGVVLVVGVVTWRWETGRWPWLDD